jgi:hypothetical protein
LTALTDPRHSFAHITNIIITPTEKKSAQKATIPLSLSLSRDAKVSFEDGEFFVVSTGGR